MALVPSKTRFTITPADGVMDTVGMYGSEPPIDATAPDWAANMVIGTWYAIGGDTPDSATLGLTATTVGTRYARDVKLAGQPTAMGDFAALMDAWNSAAYVAGLGASGSLVYWGGGHRDYQGNEILRFDLATREWSRHYGPSLVGPQGDGNWVVWPNVNSVLDEPGLFPDGTPAPPHTDAMLQYCPAENALFCPKAVQALGGTSTDGKGTFLRAYWYSFDLDEWRYSTIPGGTIRSVAQGAVVWLDALNQFAICADPGADTWITFDPTTGPNGDGTYGTWGTFHDGTSLINQDVVFAHDPVNDLIVAQDFRSARIRTKAAGTITNAWTTITLPVGLPYQTPAGRQAGGHPWDWSTELGGIVYQQDQSPNVYLITSDDGWATCSHSLLTVDANGADTVFQTNASPTSANPLYQKVRTVEYGTTVIQVGCATVDSAVWAMRLA